MGVDRGWTMMPTTSLGCRKGKENAQWQKDVFLGKPEPRIAEREIMERKNRRKAKKRNQKKKEMVNGSG